MHDNSNPSAARLAAAADYVARGWHVLILHDVVTGACSCGNPRGDARHDTAEGSGGKHPIAAAWGASAMAERTQVEAALAARPGANLGILTGQLSGIWVLDIDPRHDGHVRLAELEAQRGPLPYTYTVRTGSGGSHYYFALPDDFTPTNAKGALPPGIDVRGQGGQVVAAPSVSHAGPYWVAVDAPVAQAPAWLLEMIRARPPREAAAPGQRSEPAIEGGDRGYRYAMTAVTRECVRLADAVPGERGSVAFAVACNLIELLNSSWTGLDPAVVREMYDEAAGGAMRHGGAFGMGEAASSWESAARTVAQRGRAVPAEISGGALVEMAGGVPPFGEAPGVATSSAQQLPWTATGSGGFTLAIPASTSPETGPAPWKSESPSAPPSEQSIPSDPVDALLAELVTGAQLAAMPPPVPLIEGFLISDSTAWIIGPPGNGKSFVVLDMAMCVATGTPWRDRPVKAGLVVYLVAEGAYGMGVRHQAWEAHHGVQAGQRLLFLPRPVQASGPEWDVLVRALARLAPAMVVLDTQARVTVGMEENSNTEMGQFVEQVERIRRATGACVATVHHTTKGALVGRGAGALQGAAQTELTVVADKRAGRITVKTTKQKDGPELAPLDFRLEPVEVQIEPPVAAGEYGGITLMTPGRTESSVVLVAYEADAGDRAKIFDDELTGAQLKVAQLMAEVFNEGMGGTKPEVKKLFVARGEPERSFLRAWNALLDKGALARVSGSASYRWVPVDDRGGAGGGADSIDA